MLRAEKLLSKIEASMIPVGPSDDQETITDEEKFMYRRVGLRMKAYLPLGECSFVTATVLPFTK